MSKDSDVRKPHKERENQHKYERGGNVNKSARKRTKDKKLRAKMQRIDDQYEDALSLIHI